MSSSQQERLAKRYPLLQNVPPQERPAVARAAILHPALLGLVCVFGVLFLPPYVDFMFRLLGVNEEPSPLLFLAKLGGTVLLPPCLFVPLLGKVVMPYFIRKIMIKRGFTLPSPPCPDKEPPKEK